MDDPRLSRIYAALLQQSFAQMRRRLWHAAVMRSGMVTVVALTLGMLVLALGWHEHRMGQFGQLKQGLKRKPTAQDALTPRPGGQDVIVLQRSQFFGAAGPEFLSATLLPGQGMNVLQIKAYLPQRGEVALLASTSAEQAAQGMSGGKATSDGNSLELGGPIEAPWAGRIWGTASADGETLTTSWQGHSLRLPVTESELGSNPAASGGLLSGLASTMRSTNIMPDGGQAQASFEGNDFNGHWLSQTEMTTSMELSSRAIEMTVQARNIGTEPEPMGLGWNPHFAILSESREQATLHLPAAQRLEIADRRSGLPSGRLLPVEGTAYDFTARNGARLGSLSLEDTFVHLKAGMMDNGPAAEFRDPQSDYGLRITAMTTNIKAMHISSPAGADFISIAPQFNYEDPFGREWATEPDTGMVVLQPGQSVQWKIRLEIFSLSSRGAQPL